MRTLVRLFEDCVEKYGDNVFLLEKKNNKYLGSTFREIQEKVHLFGAGLVEMGIKKGDRIALLAEGRNDWVISELGILYAGAVNVPLSQKLTEPSEIKFRLNHAGVRFIIVSKNQAKKVLSLKNSLPDLEKVILLDQQSTYENMELPMSEVITRGKSLLKSNPALFNERWNSVQEGDYANICYTSGTTADPKGIILSHRNYTANIDQALSLFKIPRYWTTLLILPWDHAFAHTCGIYALGSCGASVASVQVGDSPMETLRNIPVNIKENRPYLILSAPALVKNFKKNIDKGIRDKGAVAERLFNFGLRVAFLHNGNGWNKGKGLRFLLKPLLILFDKILFSKVRVAFGGNLEYFIGGAALLDMDLQKYFYAIGLPIYQGYGLTEAAPVISANNPAKHKLGSSGTLVNNLELKICDENGVALPVGQIGEIIVKGENVMVGYWRNPEATADSIRNGWLYTGDLGYMDEDGFLYVLGRFKSLLIGDDGEKYSPEGIEEALVQHSKYIDQCLLFNNQNSYTTALIYPNIAAIKGWLAEKNFSSEDTGTPEKVIQLIKSQFDQFLAGGKFESMFPQRWLPASFYIIPEGFTEDNQLLNSTMKMVRPKIHERFKNEISLMYTPQGKNIYGEHNMVTVKQITG
ncbi:MAG TPA: AMP-binding protein [Bacteroidales bacterium]|jgi:long-chain acyl-CoA synthetase|nr:AMP-binding protein [Bacteroidales bacterium]